MIESNDHDHAMDLNAVNVRLDDTMPMMTVERTHSTAMNTNCSWPNRKKVRIDRERHRPLEMRIGYYLQDCHGEIPLSHTARGGEKERKRNNLIF